jgi:hypothetical protein
MVMAGAVVIELEVGYKPYRVNVIQVILRAQLC